MKITQTLTGLLLFCVLSANAGQKWFDFRTTFTLNPLAGFYQHPRTVKEAESLGWTKIGSCGDDSKFQGERYIHETNPTCKDVVIIFDVNGFIAGMQNILSTKWGENGYTNYYTSPMYQLDRTLNDREVFFTTAYFINPIRICKGGRTLTEFEREGTGYVLYFQNGPNADSDNLINIPLKQADAEKTEEWNEHLCFINMGTHFFQLGYDVNASCKDLFPVQLIYHKRQLHGFVWQHVGNFKGKTWEHPNKLAIKKIIKNPPKCLFEAMKKVGISTMHVYFKSHLLLC